MINRIMAVLLMVVLVSAFTVMPVMAATDVNGSFEVGGAPTVNVTFTPAAMDPQIAQEANVNVAMSSGTLEDLTSVVFKVFYVENWMYDEPTLESFNLEVADTQKCAIITWSPPDGWSLAPSGGGTTWALGSCSRPDLTLASGDFVFQFTPGKVAKVSDWWTYDTWQVAAKATKSLFDGFGCDANGFEMNYYVEMSISATSVSWGSIEPGMLFSSTPPSAQELAGDGIHIIANHIYAVEVQSSASWGGASTLAGTTSLANQFAIKAGTEANLSTASNPLRDEPYAYVIPGQPPPLLESGDTWPDIFLFLQLASTFDAGSYSGTITFTAD